ncbi:uncharacterized protein FMAN_13010 [Fusarium mangiferae]|uniref:F-box domain-containing protein n=1 Tax=Fusarium mangiferae TaxID=192010 RepID=A0A1L7UBH7_FUSMA|nr:uncharacterized protein FMAN_13010 [Fusarium mangiferae]CVL05027.1 uncharacterized protein FMAN_13010 [Fusarium mangiferae]
MQSLPPSDIRLPAEIVVMVCSCLGKQDQLNSRLVSGKLHYAATIQAFRSIRLKPDGDSPLQFRQIALSDKLRGFVKEVTIDTELDPGVPFHSEAEDFSICQNFLEFLPYLGMFNNLKHLHIRFSRSSNPRSNNIEESLHYRYLVLDIISHCVVGMWTLGYRKTVYGAMLPPASSHMFRYKHDTPVLLGASLQIKELTISHLVGYNDPRLIHSKAWNMLLRLPTIIDLKLLMGENHPENGTDLSAGRSEFFSALPSKWLQPDVVQKLQVLSLFYTDFWGWFPRMDLDQLGDLPSLRVLALGRYIFTDKKQTDWIAFLGQNNKSGGLEELYIDECCIMFQAHQRGPLAAGGYPILAADIERTEYDIRWHHVLSEWRMSMKGLKKFAMGVGDFGCPVRTIVPFFPWGPFSAAMIVAGDPPQWYFGHNRHRFFADPGPEDFVVRLFDAYQSRRQSSRAVPMGNYLLGAGLTQSRRARMRYASYDVRSPYGWFMGNQFTNGGYDRAWAPEQETVEFDDAAYALLMETIRDRLRS